jgi:ATP-dependent DNA helicase PIF1
MVLYIPLKRRAAFAKTCRQGRRVARRALGQELSLVDEQVNAFLDVMCGENVFLTGGAGVGKSHLLKAIIKYLPQKGLAITASTGCAAAVIGAATFHSTLCLGLGSAPSHAIVRNICKDNRWAYQRLREMQTLIIDEVGMLTGNLFDKAGLVVGGVRRDYGRGHASVMSNAQLTCPFDTVQLVVCGDALQLAPVRVEDENWVWEAKCWKNLDFKTHVLTHVHRQQDVRFIECLQRMRKGKGTVGDHQYILGGAAEVPHKGSLQLFATNQPSDNHNEHMLTLLEGRFHPFSSIDSGNNPNVSDDVLQGQLKNCPAPKRLLIKEGARVMCLRNIDINLVNGSLGTVEAVTPCYDEHQVLHHVNVDVTFDGQLGAESFKHRFSTHIPGEPASPENLFTVTGQDNRKLAQRVQIPLKLAWAVSIHKSQGMSLDRVSIDFSRTFADGQAYTALSRVKTLAGAFVKGLTLRMMRMAAAEPLAFYASLEEGPGAAGSSSVA